MQWKGIELKEINEPQVFNPPKKMLVWDNMGEKDAHPYERTVCSINKDREGETWTIAQQVETRGVTIWRHCAEIPEAPKPRRATNRETAKWLAQGNGEFTWEHDKEIRHHFFGGHSYVHGHDNDLVDSAMRVRKWDDAEWHEATVDYMGIEATVDYLGAEEVENEQV